MGNITVAIRPAPAARDGVWREEWIGRPKPQAKKRGNRKVKRG